MFAVDDTWAITTKGPYENPLKNYNATSRRNKDRKKDREKERGKERDNEKENINQIRKNLNIGSSHNIQYEDIDYSQVNSYNTNNFNSHYNVENVNRNTERKTDDTSLKNSKGFILNKPFGAWPFHTNKDSNNYYGNKTEPKYYLGIYENKFNCIILSCVMIAFFFLSRNINIGNTLLTNLQ